jgi:hypothetical protein
MAPKCSGNSLLELPSIDCRTVLSAAIVTKPAFQSMPAKVLFQFPARPYSIAVTADGKRFLTPIPLSRLQFTVVQNWQAALKK